MLRCSKYVLTVLRPSHHTVYMFWDSHMLHFYIYEHVLLLLEDVLLQSVCAMFHSHL